jgi:enamine deaminase RidA (YjgF/YER057c/UK114 family)
MPKQHVNPASLFASVEHGFSQVVVASGAKTVFISGQTAWDANKQIVGRNCGEQARQALQNVQTAVEAAGGTLSDIVALRILQPSALGAILTRRG